AGRRSCLQIGRSPYCRGSDDSACRTRPEARPQSRQQDHLHAGGTHRHRGSCQSSDAGADYRRVFRAFPKTLASGEGVMSFLNAVIDGALLGGYYAIVACGLSFMFGIMKIINLAHGSLAILGAFMLWIIAEKLGYDPLLALIVVLPAMGVLGWLLQ